MSLTDSDKGNIRRGKPTINSKDNVAQRMAHKTTTPTTYRESGSAVTARCVPVQGGWMWIDANDNVSSVYMYIPELAEEPVQIIAKAGYDVFEDVLSGEVERPTV